MSDRSGGQIYILVTIDCYSKHPSVMLTRTTGAKNISKVLKDYISIHSIPKSIRTDQYSGFKNNAVKSFCVSKGSKHILCPVGDHRGCGLVERTIQPIKRKLGVMQLEKNPTSIESALKTLIEDIIINKNSVTNFSPFELQFGRKPNSEWSLMSEKLKSNLFLDSKNLERDVLTAEQRRKNCDSRERVKIVMKGSRSPDITPRFSGPTTSVVETPYYQALEKLAKSANEYTTLKRSLTQEQGAEALRTLTDRNQILAASLRSNLSTGTLRFRADIPKLKSSKSQVILIISYFWIRLKLRYFVRFLIGGLGRIYSDLSLNIL